MNLPKFRLPTKVLVLVLVVLVLLGGAGYWFSQTPPNRRPLGLFASGCNSYFFFSRTSQVFKNVNYEGASAQETVDATYTAYPTNSGIDYCGQIDLRTHLTYTRGSRNVGNSYIGFMQSSISSGHWLTGDLYIPDNNASYVQGTGTINLSHPCDYNYSTTFYSALSAAKNYSDVETPLTEVTTCIYNQVPGLR